MGSYSTRKWFTITEAVLETSAISAHMRQMSGIFTYIYHKFMSFMDRQIFQSQPEHLAIWDVFVLFYFCFRDFQQKITNISFKKRCKTRTIKNKHVSIRGFEVQYAQKGFQKRWDSYFRVGSFLMVIPLIFPNVPQSSWPESLGFPRNTPSP